MSKQGSRYEVPLKNEPPDVKYSAAARQLAIEERVALASRAGSIFGSSANSIDQDFDLVALLGTIVRDAEERVRAALSIAASSNPRIPKEVALALANDVDIVSLPFLQASTVLASAELINIVKTSRSLTKMTAIARRASVPPDLSETLVVEGDANVAIALLENKGASITEESTLQILERHPDSIMIQERLVARPSLPPTVLAKLIHLVTAELTERIVLRHGLPPDVAVELATESRTRATIGLSSGLSAKATDTLIDGLISEGMVTAQFLVQCLSIGNFEFFCRCLSILTLESIFYLMRRLVDAPDTHLPEYWRRAGLSETLLPKAIAAVSVLMANEVDTDSHETESYRLRIIEGVLSQFGALEIELEEEDSAFMFAAYEKSRHALAARYTH